MLNYYPHLHTPENLEHQVSELYSKYPKMLVVGSLGRATVFNSVIGNPYFEFAERKQHPLHANGTARDIDVIGAEHEVVFRTLPFWVDATSYDINGTQIGQENDDWFIAVKGQYEAPLHPSVMEPVNGETIYGIPCQTLPPETQLALLKVRGRFRPKDAQTFSLLSNLLEVRDTQDRLPPELFKPFERVHEVNIARAA